MNFTDLAKSYVRTIVPVLVGLVISLALRAGIDLHGYAPEVTAVVTAVYYCAARAAEHYLSPKFGWLLGVASLPKYGSPKISREVAAGLTRKRGQAGYADVVAVVVIVLLVLLILVLLGAIR